jgi:hypothetical protein
MPIHSSHPIQSVRRLFQPFAHRRLQRFMQQF